MLPPAAGVGITHVEPVLRVTRDGIVLAHIRVKSRIGVIIEVVVIVIIVVVCGTELVTRERFAVRIQLGHVFVGLGIHIETEIVHAGGRGRVDVFDSNSTAQNVDVGVVRIGQSGKVGRVAV